MTDRPGFHGSSPCSAAAQPEQPGPFQVDVWQNPPSTPVPCYEGVFYPRNAPCPGAPVALVHGGGENGTYKVKMAQLVASRGLVAVLPSFMGALINPTQADGKAISDLLEWTVQQSQNPSSPIAGKVDATQYGVAGHSNGGIAFYAASINPKIKAIIGWDAVAGLTYASGFQGPSLHLLGQGNRCGGGSSAAYNAAPTPKAMSTVISGSHCDFNDPQSPFCAGVCGTPPWNAQAAAMIERYSVAWFTCLLGHDPSMQEFVDYATDQQGLTGSTQSGSVTCQPAGACGGGGSDAAGTAGTGAGAGQGGAGAAGFGGTGQGGTGQGGLGGSGAQGGASGQGGGAGAAGAPVEGGAAESGGGCGCRSGSGSATWAASLAFAAAFGGVIRFRRRRRRLYAARPANR